MIAHRLVDLLPSGASAGPGRLTLRPGKCGSAQHREAADLLPEEASLPRVEEAAWGWRLVACRLILLLVIASVTYLYVRGAAAFYRTFNQPTSLGSEWDALTSGNSRIPPSTFQSQYP